jgi:ribonuclease BN (tRNA processing enzyme)
MFVTHLHSDHIFDFGNILYMKWEAAVFLNKPVTMDVYGPAPLSKLVDATFAYFHPDVTYRADGDDKLLWKRSHVTDHDFTAAQIRSGVPFKVFEDDRVKVHAVGVVHPPVPTVAYRFDTDDMSITFSADTAPTPSLTRLAKGSDILIHEAFHKPTVERLFPADASFDFASYMDTVHTSADDVGKVASAAGVKQVVLNHLYPSSPRIVPPAKWRKAVHRHYDGRVVVGEELMVVG